MEAVSNFHPPRMSKIHPALTRCSQIIRTCGRQPWPGEDHNLVFLGSSSNFGKVDKSRVAPAALLGERSIRPSTDFHRFRGFAPITPSNFPPSLVWAAPPRSFAHSTPPGFDSPVLDWHAVHKSPSDAGWGAEAGCHEEHSVRILEIGGNRWTAPSILAEREADQREPIGLFTPEIRR